MTEEIKYRLYVDDAIICPNSRLKHTEWMF